MASNSNPTKVKSRPPSFDDQSIAFAMCVEWRVTASNHLESAHSTLCSAFFRCCVLCQVIDGLDVLDVIEKAPVGKKERPVTDIIIKHVNIHANPIAEK